MKIKHKTSGDFRMEVRDAFRSKADDDDLLNIHDISGVIDRLLDAYEACEIRDGRFDCPKCGTNHRVGSNSMCRFDPNDK